MAHTADAEGDVKPRSTRLRTIVFGVLSILLGAVSGYILTDRGLVPSFIGSQGASALSSSSELTYFELDPILVNLPSGGNHSHLKISAHLEISSGFESKISAELPRIMDIMLTYLRAIRVRDLEEQSALFVIRSELLQRVKIIVGQNIVHDILIDEFILN